MHQERPSVRGAGRGAWSGFPRAVVARPVRAGVAIALLVPQLAGCFHYVPVGSQPLPSGSEVSVGLTDLGRVQMAEQVGPGVRRIGGNLLENGDTSLLLSVTSVQYLDLDVTARWAGEPVEVPRRYIGELRERQLSRSRTFLTLGLVVVGLVASTFVAISGFGTDGGPTRPGDGDNGQT
jgi:hypothetical protein